MRVLQRAWRLGKKSPILGRTLPNERRGEDDNCIVHGVSEGRFKNAFRFFCESLAIRSSLVLPSAKGCIKVTSGLKTASVQNESPLTRGAVKELRERLEHVPPRTRGDFRGVTGNPHQVLIQQWIPPSSPPLAKGGRVREQRASARTHEFFHTFRGQG